MTSGTGTHRPTRTFRPGLLFGLRIGALIGGIRSSGPLPKLLVLGRYPASLAL